MQTVQRTPCADPCAVHESTAGFVVAQREIGGDIAESRRAAHAQKLTHNRVVLFVRHGFTAASARAPSM